MHRPHLVPVLLAASMLAALAAYVVPRGIEAGATLAIADDPVEIADRALDRKFNAAVASREIETALAAQDADLAQSFVALADARHVALDPALRTRVAAAVEKASSARHMLVSFTRGFVAGEPTDGAALAGTALGDLFVFGDIRDAVREGTHWVLGEPTNKAILALAGVGLAVTAATYASVGAAEPARLGFTLAKAVRKTGQMSRRLTASLDRMLREGVRLRRAGGLVNLAGDVGRIERKAGTRAAMEAMQVAQTPREVSRIAKLAEKEGGKTRAIVKLLGRGAIMLTVGAFDLSVWILGALFTLLAFVSSLKNATERITLRVLRRRKERRQRKALRQMSVPAHA